MTYIVLLRGINLGARNRVAMGALRELLTGAGLQDVRTYLQSGNVVLSSTLAPRKLASVCERHIGEQLGLDIAVVVRTRDELAKVVEHDPLARYADDPKLYQVSFCSTKPRRDSLSKLAEWASGDERLVAHGREIYAWFPDGIGRSRLAAQLSKQSLGVTATARNWKTVCKLLELAQ